MKFLLVGLNAKYIHSNLAVHYLKANAKEYREYVEIAEYTINNHLEDIMGDIYRKKPDIIGFSCYIWNINMIYDLARELRKILPKVKIWLGGPEVSFDANMVLENHSYIDGVMVGEGEETFHQLLEVYVDKKGILGDVLGITYREAEAIYSTGCRPPMDLSKVPFPYHDLGIFENKIVYYETSRGCPYSCSYCLSSVDKKVRFRDIELVKKELQVFLDAKVPQVKFIDRTFNCYHKHTMAIWNYIKEHDNGITNFHFEVSADILNEEELTLLNSMRPGLVQLEIGVQSTNLKTIDAIHRKMDFKKLSAIVDRIHKGDNIHQHLDLIVGLPYEDYNSFGRSFNDVYALHPNQLQLGFLKVLKGSLMHDMSEEYHIIYHSLAPYEVLYTNWISYDEVLRLKQIEEMVEVYYNSGQFTYTIGYMEHCFTTPFEMFEKLAEYYDKHQLFDRSHARIQRYYILLDFYETVVKEHVEEFKELLVYDCYLREKMKSRPTFARQSEKEQKEYYHKFKQMGKLTHVEEFTIDVNKTAKTGTICKESMCILFDYSNRSLLNHEAMTTRINQE